MKRIIQAAVVAVLFTGAQAALAFASGADDITLASPSSTYADRYADKGAPSMAFPSSGDPDVLPVGSSTYAERHANEIARAPMEFPSTIEESLYWVGTPTRADRFASGASDAALSQ